MHAVQMQTQLTVSLTTHHKGCISSELSSWYDFWSGVFTIINFYIVNEKYAYSDKHSFHTAIIGMEISSYWHLQENS